jgi:hypothetical protein
MSNWENQTSEDYQIFCDVINKWQSESANDNRHIAQIITNYRLASEKKAIDEFVRHVKVYSSTVETDRKELISRLSQAKQALLTAWGCMKLLLRGKPEGIGDTALEEIANALDVLSKVDKKKEDDSAFGTHIKEATAILKDWKRNP